MPKSFIKINKLKIGYYLFSITEKDFYVHNLEINLEYRGKGYFKTLIENIKEEAVKNNCETITLCPEYQNDESSFNSTEKLKTLYEKYGFKELEYNNNFHRFSI